MSCRFQLCAAWIGASQVTWTWHRENVEGSFINVFARRRSPHERTPAGQQCQVVLARLPAAVPA